MLPSNCNTWFARPLLIRRFFLNTCIRLQIVFSPLQWQSYHQELIVLKIQATLPSTASLSCLCAQLPLAPPCQRPRHYSWAPCFSLLSASCPWILARCCNYLGHWCGCYKKESLNQVWDIITQLSGLLRARVVSVSHKCEWMGRLRQPALFPWAHRASVPSNFVVLTIFRNLSLFKLPTSASQRRVKRGKREQEAPRSCLNPFYVPMNLVTWSIFVGIETGKLIPMIMCSVKTQW